MRFARGEITQELKIVGQTDKTGSTIIFKPDPEIFEELTFNYETILTRMREQAFLNAGLKIRTIDERPGSEAKDEMCYAGGIREFVTYINRNKTALHEDVIYLTGSREDSLAEWRFSITTVTMK